MKMVRRPWDPRVATKYSGGNTRKVVAPAVRAKYAARVSAPWVWVWWCRCRWRWRRRRRQRRRYRWWTWCVPHPQVPLPVGACGGAHPEQPCPPAVGVGRAHASCIEGKRLAPGVLVAHGRSFTRAGGSARAVAGWPLLPEVAAHASVLRVAGRHHRAFGQQQRVRCHHAEEKQLHGGGHCHWHWPIGTAIGLAGLARPTTKAEAPSLMKCLVGWCAAWCDPAHL